MTQEQTGKWGFVTGNRRISAEKWRSCFPQNWFGKVIGVKKKGRCNYLELRCYRPKSKNRKRHPHIITELIYFKQLTPPSSNS